MILAAGLVLSLGVGYQLGAHYGKPVQIVVGPTSTPSISVQPEVAEDSDDEESASDGNLSYIKAGWNESCKMVFVVRTDLGMSPGKIAAQ